MLILAIIVIVILIIIIGNTLRLLCLLESDKLFLPSSVGYVWLVACKCLADLVEGQLKIISKKESTGEQDNDGEDFKSTISLRVYHSE